MYSIIDEDDAEATFEFKKSSDINTCIINTIRRIAMSSINVFALPVDKIVVTSNTSILNNDQLKHRISLLPLFHIPNIENDSLIQIGVNKHNETTEVISVTTNDCIVKVNNKLVENKFPNPPILICKIKPTQKVEFVAISEYNNASIHNIFAASKISYFEENDNSFELTIETTGQLTATEILVQSCKYCITHLQELLNNILEKNKLNINTIDNLIIHNENHTMGNLLATMLQQKLFINYAAYKVDHPNNNFIEMSITTDKSKTIEESLKIVVKDAQNIFNKILKT